MLRALLIGLPVLVLCMVLQAIFVGVSLRWYGGLRALVVRNRHWRYVWILSAVLKLALVGNLLQMAMWALLFLAIGEFSDYSSALYHSAVNFTTLGYGDVVMSPRFRLLGALEAANGILMFGVSTAMMTAAVIDLLKHEAKARGVAAE